MIKSAACVLNPYNIILLQYSLSILFIRRQPVGNTKETFLKQNDVRDVFVYKDAF